jgi:hypothetical protein
VSYAIVGSVAAAIARNIYLDFDVAFVAGARRPFAWAVAPPIRPCARILTGSSPA